MRLLKPRYLTLAVLIAIMLGVWLARATIAEQLATSLLRSYGLTEISIDIDQLGFEQSDISHLGFSLATATGLFRLEFNDASVAYSPSQFVKGRVKSVSVNRLSAAYTDSEPQQLDSPDRAFEPFLIIAGLRQALRKYIIFDSFIVRHAVLKGDAFAMLQDRPLRLSGTNDKNTTSAELYLPDPEAPERKENSRQIIISQLADNRITVELRQPAVPDRQPARIELNVSDTLIDGVYTIEPDALGLWLRPFAGVTGIAGTGTIKGKLVISLESADTIKSSITASAPMLSTDDYRVDRLSIQLNLDIPSRYPPESVSVMPDSFIKADRFDTAGVSVSKTRLDLAGALSITNAAWQYSGTVSSDAMTVTYEARAIPFNAVNARVSANPKKIEVNGEFASAATPGRFALTLSHNAIDQAGSLSVTPLQAIDLNAEDQQLSRLLTPWPYSFDILTGTIEVSAYASWSRSRALSLTITTRLDDAGGHFGELVFSGLASRHELDILPALKSKRTSTISLEYLDSGVTASNISTRLTLLPAESGALPQVEIQDLHGEIFGGSFSADDFTIDLNRRDNRFRISARDIDLAKVVETQQLDDIAVTGRIDGIIPVQISDTGVSIEDGAFINNVRAGTIRYNPASGTDQLKQNPLTGIALDALRDFRYDYLSAEVNFKPDGMLTVNLKLKGTSPELETTRPVHLNINTEQNVLSLLKSLRYAEGISVKIDRKVRRQYQSQRQQ